MTPVDGRCPSCHRCFDDHNLSLTPADPPICPKKGAK